ncbi:AAA family ATPase [Nonomuraea sp. MG754425]|uniref:ATP-binding protein n=1 Tax=Nonomuraea sp. MG754425 TaxID=2570319 RepID=UPI001F454A7C|nr:AAA family ATPase [Nonomuraea sp. MG754425]
MRPLPASPALVGRDTAVTTVADALRGPATLVVIEGEAGIGKTRLVHECLDSAELRDRRIAQATCPPLYEPFPLGPLVDALRRVWEQAGRVELSPLGGALRPLFPEWAADLPPLPEPATDPRSTRYRLFRALAELIERLGVDVLVVEDAHWADAATLEWLVTMAASGGHHASVVVTYRPLDVPPDSLLLRLTSRVPAGMAQARIVLDPLDVTQTGLLIASLFGVESVSASFAEFLHEHTGGIPLALEESVRLLRDRRDIVLAHGRWTRRVLEDLKVPPTVRDSVLERVARLDPGTLLVLRAVAVLGVPVGAELIATVAGLDEPSVLDGVADGLGCGLLRESDPGEVTFRHILAAKAVEEAVPVSTRRLLHRRAGEALSAAAHPPVVRLSRHFREAGDVARWSEYAEASAAVAVESGDDHTAVTVLHELLSTAGHPPERRVRLARKLGGAATMGADPIGELGTRICATIESVLDDGVPRDADRGELRLLLGRLKLQLRYWEAGLADVEAAVPDLEAQPELAARAMLYLATPVNEAWPAARHLRWAERAAPLFSRITDPTELLLFVCSRTIALLMLGEESGWESAREIPDGAPPGPQRRELVRGVLSLAHCAILWGRTDEAVRRIEEGGRILAHTAFHRMIGTARIAQAHLAWCTGAWDELAESATALTEAPEGEITDRLEAQRLLGELTLARGSRTQAERLLRGVLEESAALGHANPFAFPNTALARICLSDGEPGAALDVTTPVMDLIERKGIWLWATDIAPVHVEALIGAGQPDRARDLVAAFRAPEGAPAPAAALATCHALVAADPATAADLYGLAAARWAAIPRPYDELLTLERQGRALLAAGRTDEALAVLADARERLRALDARWDADRVARLLREHGVDVTLAWRGGRRGYGDQLSPRELNVIALVVKGWTNRKVAEALHLSPRTVDRHLSTAMRKLAVSSRTELARVAAEREIVG